MAKVVVANMKRGESYTPSENFIFRNFLKNDPIRSNFMRETRWRCYFCVKTFHFFNNLQKVSIEDKESTYFEKANMQKFDFLKDGSIFTQK